MILGIGTDIIEIDRVLQACEKESFVRKVFSEKEIAYIMKKGEWSGESGAGNFAVKESVAKAFGTGIVGFSVNEIEVLRDEKGKPFVNLLGRAKEVGERLGVIKIHASLSHCEDKAVGYVIIESN